jgi:LysM repeat protein
MLQAEYYEEWRDLMRSWGHRVIEVAGCFTRDAEPRTRYTPGRLYVEHHDASSLLSGNWGALAYITRNNLANIVTARDGQVALNAVGVQHHAGKGGPRWDVPAGLGNPNSLGNEVCNSGRESYSPECTRAVIDTEVAWAIVSGRAAELHRLLGHKEWATPAGRKSDPSLSMDVRRQQVARRLAEVAGRPPVAPAPAPAGAHTVTAGQTLYGIARLRGVTVAQLREWNGLTGDALAVGQSLRVTVGPSPAPAPAPAPAAGVGAAPAWDLPAGHYLGHIAGPERSHGGADLLDRDNVLYVQRKWITLGCVPGITDWRSPWADGRWEDATTAACRRWFARFRASQPVHTQVWSDDYAFLARQ